MHIHRLAILATVLGSTAAPVAQASLTVQVVNDSGLPDSKVYLLLTGNSLDVAGMAVAKPTGNDPAVSSRAVDTLASTGFGTLSPLTGEGRIVYKFTINSITGGVLYVSYDNPISYGDNAPTAEEKLRFDKMEITYGPDIDSVADLTSIDFFGIPIQIERFAGSGYVPKATKTFYTSTATLIAAVDDLVQPPGAPDVFRDTSDNPWDPSSGSLTDFARILAPGHIASGKLNGSPSPYPSFDGYLASLVRANYIFTESGSANTSAYDYTGSIAGDGKGGYKITLAGTTEPAPPSPLPTNSTITILLPNGNLTSAKQTINMDTFIYGAVLNSDSFNLSGCTTACESEFNDIAPNSVYGWIVADVLSGLNFGYLNGKYGNHVANWYKVPPTEFPFGGARAANDGFYNPWAALIYNNSDAYGFAFSDRSGPSPAMPLENGDTLQITILPDQRLDAPRITVGDATSNSIPISWPAVTGATGYNVSLLPPSPAGPIFVPASSGTSTYTIQDLKSGTPYAISVVATGTAAYSNNPLQSVAIPVQGVTTGDVVPTTGSIPFVMGFNWGAAPAGATGSINGSALSNLNGGAMPLTGAPGTNYYALRIEGTDKNVLFQNNYVITLRGAASSYRLGMPFFLTGNQTPLAQTGPPGTPPYTNTNQATIGTPFTPLADKAIYPVTFPRLLGQGIHPGRQHLKHWRRWLRHHAHWYEHLRDIWQRDDNAHDRP